MPAPVPMTVPAAVPGPGAMAVPAAPPDAPPAAPPTAMIGSSAATWVMPDAALSHQWEFAGSMTRSGRRPRHARPGTDPWNPAWMLSPMPVAALAWGCVWTSGSFSHHCCAVAGVAAGVCCSSGSSVQAIILCTLLLWPVRCSCFYLFGSIWSWAGYMSGHPWRSIPAYQQSIVFA